MTFAKTFKLAHLRTAQSFLDLYSPMSALLDTIKSEAAKGDKEGPTAYAQASSGKPKLGADGQPVKGTDGKVVKDKKGASDYVDGVVSTLSTEQLNWAWTGLGLTSAQDKRAKDVVGSVVSAWDRAASKYMKKDNGGGDAERSKFKDRLKEFDTAISSKGATPVKKDE